MKTIKKRIVENYNEIIKGLFLGNMTGAVDKKFFKEKNIRAVLNCTVEVKDKFKCDQAIEYMRIPVEDSLNTKDFKLLYEYFPTILEFIYKNLVIEKKNVFVHCYQGRQRSAAAIAMYLIWTKKMDPDDAYDYILNRRAEAFHYGESFNFDWSINKFFNKHLKKN